MDSAFVTGLAGLTRLKLGFLRGMQLRYHAGTFRAAAEAVMRGVVILFAALTISGIATGALAAGKIRLAQSSNATNCMMTCNAQAASCRTGCLVPGTPPTAAATSTSNATASTMCLLNCGNSQLSCQTSCSLQSPSQ
jgi:hypothetical protein